ncbi:otolith matrix protein OMM-64-like [Diaphorina citri]|uniref:Otolith matrix protein OMM-64-like n=1 Tax=Diaphorina citri TaxID=121845 RepID=A0A1S3DJU3_DIACI|nr:otolith matrix protein OMM-64-like [Diaphorina citri]XP_008483071.1 otolith matrix protein OMM-64-like [Diaphorina citri]
MRRPSYPHYGSYGSFSDEFTQMLDELQKSLLSTRVGSPSVSVSAPRIPVFGVSTSTSTDEDDDDTNVGGTSVSISGAGFGPFFRLLGGLDGKDLKNKTTVKTEVINGRKVTVKDSTYVSDTNGIKTVIHLSEVDMGDSASDGDKPKASTPKTEDDGGEETDEKEDKPESSTPSEVDEDKSESTPESEPKSSTEKNTSGSNDENNETSVKNNSDEKREKSNRHPDSEVEEIEPFGDGNNYFNYNVVDKIKAKEDQMDAFVPVKENWMDNTIDSQLSAISRSKRQAPGRVVSLQDDTRVNQILSEKQKSSGLYSIDPDAELLDENTYYEVEGRRPSNQQQVFFYQQNQEPTGNSVYGNSQQVARRPNYEPQYQRRQNYQQPQARPPRYENADDYQRVLPVGSQQFHRADIEPERETYQRSLPVDYQRQQVVDSYARGDMQSQLPVTFN